MRFSAMHLSLLLLLPLSCLFESGEAALWFRKDDPRQPSSRPRRRLTDIPQEHVDVDAATGTVKRVLTEEQRERAEQAKTCDGQLAQALVAANDAELKAQQERDEAREAKDVAMKQIAQLQVTIQTLEKQVEDLKAQVKAAVQQGEAEQSALKTRLQTAEADKVAAVAAAEKAKDEMIASLKKKLDATKDDVQLQMEAQLEEANANAQAAIAALTAKLEKQKQEAEELVKTTKEESKRVLVEHVASIKEQSNAALLQKDETITQLQAENKRISASTQEYEKEIEHWRSTFANRTYCNMTQISDDIYEITMNAYSHAAQAASVAATKTAHATTLAATKTAHAASLAATNINVHGQRLAKELVVKAEYGYKKSIQIYNEQYNKHWPTIKPHYDQHVAPLVDKFLVFKAKEIDPKLNSLKKEYLKIKTHQIDPRLEQFNTERERRFEQLVTVFEAHCNDAYQLSRQLAKDHNQMDKFREYGPMLKETCDDPEHSVTIGLRIMVAFLLLPFVGLIFGLAWGIVRLVWNIFLTVTLIRFFLPRRSTTSTTKKQAIKVKKEKSVGGGSPVKNNDRSKKIPGQ